MLKHHRQSRAKALQLFGVARMQLAVFVGLQFERFAFEGDAALIRVLELIHAT